MFWGLWNHPEALQHSESREHFGGLMAVWGGCTILGLWDHCGGVAAIPRVAELGFLDTPAKAAAGKRLPASPSQKIPPAELGSGSSPGSPERRHRGEHPPSLGHSRIIFPINNNRSPFFPRRRSEAGPSVSGSRSWRIWVEIQEGWKKSQERARYSCSVYGTGRIHCATPRSVNYHRAINRAEKDPRAPRGHRRRRLARFGTSTFLL